jgi:hypothetical protein
VNRPSMFVAAAVFAAVGFAGTAAHAQEAPQQFQNVVSANPFGLLLELFNAEYERVVGESSTVGIGGSFFSSSEENDFDPTLDDVEHTYSNIDVFYRFYPSARPLDGWAFGGKVGVTRVKDDDVASGGKTFFGYGFDVNRSWLIGKKNNFYVGIGFGLKKLVGAKDESFDLEYIPTFRIINIGFAF